MKSFNSYSFILLLFCLILFPSISLADDIDPDTIDPFDETAGDFLDIDISEFDQMAWEAYQNADYEQAAKIYLALLQYNITDGNAIYNLACCYGLMGEAELAAKYVERAFNAGFTDVEHISWDPDFDTVRGNQVFDRTVEELAIIVEERASVMGSTVYTRADTFLDCRIQLPCDFDPAESYTLLVGLHGYGSNPDKFITLWDRFAETDFIYVSPRAPYPFAVGNDIGFSWNTWDPNDENLWARTMELTENYVAGVVEELTREYNIDNVYLMGFSQGCMMAYVVGIRYHDFFDGLICFGGWLDDEWLSIEDIYAARNLRVFIAHGNEDRMVEIESGIAAMDLLDENCYDVTFYEFEGAHRVPEDALRAAEAWMKQ